ncbi:hypothetical protein [Lysobacter sp. HA18]
MSSPNRFAKRKALGLPRVMSETSGQLEPRADVFVTAIDQILDARARQRFEERMHESKMVLLRTVAVPFGLGHLVSAYDRVGGDVNTIHNARNGVYATAEKQQEYENRGAFKPVGAACRKTEEYEASRNAAKAAQKSGTLVDAYTGRLIAPDDMVPDIDHTVSAHELFHDAARVLAGIKTQTLANIPGNLNPTHMSINRSKKAKSTKAYLAELEVEKEHSISRVAALEGKSELLHGEQMELRARKAKLTVDPDMMSEREAVARSATEGKTHLEWYGGKTFAYEVLTASVSSAAKTGVMAAFGEFLVEFLAACYDEASDWYLNGDAGKPIFEDLECRLARVADRVMARKQAAWDALRAGSLAGFVASLISVIINVFRTTQKRVQKMLREGAEAVVRTVTLLVRGADGMSTREAVYAATHLVTASGIVMGGIALEEILENAIKVQLPPLVVIAEPTAVVLSGVVSGLAVVLTASLLDRWDPYGVVEEGDLRRAIGQLSSELEDVWGSGRGVEAY